MSGSLMLLPAALLVTIGCSNPCQAQDAPSAAAPTSSAPSYRFYGGVHAAVQHFSSTALYPDQEANLKPVYLFLGYQISPHLAVQAGYLQSNRHYIGGYQYSSTPGTVTVTDSRQDAYYGAVPVMLRYRLARRPTHRLHLDALLGATLLFSHYESSYRQTTNGQLQTDYLLELRSRNLFVTGGLGAGFDLTPHVELMLEGTANWNTGITEAQSPQKLMPGVGAGLRYRFNVRKPAAS